MTLKELIASDVEDVFLNTEEFAESCTVHAGADSFEVDLIWEGRSESRRSDRPDDEGVLPRVAVAIGSVAQWNIDGTRVLPQAGWEIERIDADTAPRTHVVFPMVGQEVFRHSDHTKTMFRVYTVDRNDMAQVFYDSPIMEGFSLDMILGEIRGDLVEEGSGNLIKVMRQTAHAMTRQLVDAGVTEVQRNVTIYTARFTDWSVDLSQSRWGAGRVTLELIRKPVANLKNMERNAAV